MIPERAYYVYGNELPDNSVPEFVDVPKKKEKKQFERVVNPNAKRLPVIEKEKVIFKYVTAVTLMAAIILFSVGYSFSQAQSASMTLQETQERYDVIAAQNKELNTKLNALVASADIEKIAVEELGMVKITPENEFYLDVDRGNQIIDVD